MPDPTKKGDFDDILNVITEPSRDPASPVSSCIYVYYTEAVTYALPIDKCRTWFVSIATIAFATDASNQQVADRHIAGLRLSLSRVLAQRFEIHAPESPGDGRRLVGHPQLSSNL